MDLTENPLPQDLQQVVVVRSDGGRVTAAVVGVAGTALVALNLWQHHWHDALQLASWVALLGYLVWWMFVASSLRVDAHGVLVDNPLRWTRMPWSELGEVRVHWGLHFGPGGRQTAWAVPAASGLRPTRLSGNDPVGPLSRRGTVVAMPSLVDDIPSISGPAATLRVSLAAAATARLLEESRLLARAAGTESGGAVRRGVHWLRPAVLAALILLVYLASQIPLG